MYNLQSTGCDYVSNQTYSVDK